MSCWIEDVAALLSDALLPCLTQLQKPMLHLLVAAVHRLHIEAWRKQAPGFEVPRGSRAARQGTTAPVTLLRLPKLINVWYVLCSLHEFPLLLLAYFSCNIEVRPISSSHLDFSLRNFD